jgi:hypothetical protein
VDPNAEVDSDCFVALPVTVLLVYAADENRPFRHDVLLQIEGGLVVPRHSRGIFHPIPPQYVEIRKHLIICPRSDKDLEDVAAASFDRERQP